MIAPTSIFLTAKIALQLKSNTVHGINVKDQKISTAEEIYSDFIAWFHKSTIHSFIGHPDDYVVETNFCF